MRIGVDARYLAAQPSGIGRYSRALLEAMFRLAPDNEWVVLVHESLPPGWPPQPPPRLELHRSPHPPVSLHTLGALGRWVRERRLDLWHALFPLAPWRCPVPLTVTVHDLQPLLCPGWTGGRLWPPPRALRAFYRWAYGHAVRQARAVVADSRWTAETVRAAWPDVGGRVQILTPGLDDNWIAAARDDRCPPRLPRVLFVGSTRPNKNLLTLVEAFARLRRLAGVPPDLRLRLVLTRDRHWRPVERRLDALRLWSQIEIAENVPEEALALEYRRAAVLAHVGTHEGFGYPPLEAMAMGCPVVAARHGALPETCGEAAEFVDPTSAEEISHALLRVLSDERRREELVAAGRRHVARFRWDSTVHGLCALWSATLRQGPENSAPGKAVS